MEKVVDHGRRKFKVLPSRPVAFTSLHVTHHHFDERPFHRNFQLEQQISDLTQLLSSISTLYSNV
jgi:hypothetical protein